MVTQRVISIVSVCFTELSLSHYHGDRWCYQYSIFTMLVTRRVINGTGVSDYSKPTVHLAPGQTPQEGKEVTLRCSSGGGYPEARIHWFDHNGSNLSAAAQFSFTQALDKSFNLTSELTITQNSSSLSYNCSVINQLGEAETSSELLFLLDEELIVSQSPEFISALKGHSAEITCSISLSSKIDGLYLKRRFARPQDVLYFSLAKMKINIEKEYKGRLTHHGECCSFAFTITQLQLNDSDGYYCIWGGLDMTTGMLVSYESMGTLIVVKEPRVSCPTDSSRSNLSFILLLLMVSAGVVVVCVFMCVLLWHCTGGASRPSTRL
ncbi:UNVERIFIED_CONTAM: hypothetical protein FKN15_015209 [Acipenser sinensis]